MHTHDMCPLKNIKRKRAYSWEPPVDEFPQIPVTTKPTKTAAALETERKHAEKLAGMEANGGGEEKGKGKEEEWEWDGVGDLIDFD